MQVLGQVHIADEMSEEDLRDKEQQVTTLRVRSKPWGGGGGGVITCGRGQASLGCVWTSYLYL